MEPLLNRIDIHIEVSGVGYDKLNGNRLGEARPFCKLQDEGQSWMRAAMSQLNLSARAYHCILKLARTIAVSSEVDSKPHTHMTKSVSNELAI